MRQLLASVCLGAVWLLSSAQASDDSPGRGVPTVTRLVKLFIELEQSLDQRLAANDTAGAERLLSDDFEQRNESAPGNPVPRGDWLRQTPRPRLGEISQMAVHDYGNVAVVSFLAIQGGKRAFMVDVWKNRQGEWQLATRYASGSAAQPTPPAAIPKKY